MAAICGDYGEDARYEALLRLNGPPGFFTGPAKTLLGQQGSYMSTPPWHMTSMKELPPWAQDDSSGSNMTSSYRSPRTAFFSGDTGFVGSPVPVTLNKEDAANSAFNGPRLAFGPTFLSSDETQPSTAPWRSAAPLLQRQQPEQEPWRIESPSLSALPAAASGSATPPPPPPPGIPAPWEMWARTGSLSPSEEAVPEPPLPYPVLRPPSCPEPASGYQSVGTEGHPLKCAGPCPYVKRRGGCKEGVRCSKCHLCFWQRESVRCKETRPRPDGLMQGVAAPAVPAAAAVRAGEQTPLPLQMVSAFSGSVLPDLDGEGSSEEDHSIPSVGSIGHPYTCSLPCKYNRKERGCKDGRCCLRCHLCQWRARAGNSDKLAGAGAGAGAGSTRP